VLYWVETDGDLRHVSDEGPDLPTVRGFDAAFDKLLWLLVS